MKPSTLVPLILIGAVAVAMTTRKTAPKDTTRAGVSRDLSLLLPGFRRRVLRVLRAMRARGYEPMVWEAYRTPERAAMLAKRGTGIANSLHIYRAAVDIVDKSTAPNYWTGKPGFWKALGEEAEREGLTWGGRFRRRDLTHVQAIPVREQVAFRAATEDERRNMTA